MTFYYSLCSWSYFYQLHPYGRSTSRQLCIQWPCVNGLKLAVAGVFTPWKLGDATNWGSLLPQPPTPIWELSVVNIYQHTTGWNPTSSAASCLWLHSEHSEFSITEENKRPARVWMTSAKPTGQLLEVIGKLGRIFRREIVCFFPYVSRPQSINYQCPCSPLSRVYLFTGITPIWNVPLSGQKPLFG